METAGFALGVMRPLCVGSFWRVPYVKTSVRITRSGTARYLQMARNERDPATQRSRTGVLYNFGREDETGKDAVRRLVASLSGCWIRPVPGMASSRSRSTSPDG